MWNRSGHQTQPNAEKEKNGHDGSRDFHCGSEGRRKKVKHIFWSDTGKINLRGVDNKKTFYNRLNYEMMRIDSQENQNRYNIH